jgi:O-antigen/teichoic acid export membrane protein
LAFGDTASVGYYAVLYQLGYYPILLATELAQQLFAPILFSRAGDGRDAGRSQQAAHLNNRLIAAACLLTITGTGFAWALHKPLFHIALSSEYHTISWLLPWIVLAGGLFACGQIAALSVLSTLDSTTLAPAKIVTSLAGSASFFLGAHISGLPGVVGVGVANSTVYFVWMLCLAMKAQLAAAKTMLPAK